MPIARSINVNASGAVLVFCPSSQGEIVQRDTRHVKTLDYRGVRVDTDNMATVSLTPAAAKQLDRLPKDIHARINRILERLASWPAVSGAKPLSGNLAGSYRLRTGDYRLRFRVKGEAVVVDKIGHRSDFYED